MAHTSQALVFVTGSGINVNSDTSEGTRKGFGSDADSIWQRGDLI